MLFYKDKNIEYEKSAQSNLGRGPRRRESRRRGGLILTAKVVDERRRVYYAAPASTDTVGCGASVKLFELSVCTPGGLFWGVWYVVGF